MASKHELGSEIAKLKRENHRLELRNSVQLTELARLRDEDRRRQEHNRREAQRKREEQQHKERREHLDHLGAGRLSLSKAETWSIVSEAGGQTGIEVFVPLDAEELRVVQEYLKPKPEPKPIKFTFGADSPVGSWLDELRLGRPQHHALISGRFI